MILNMEKSWQADRYEEFSVLYDNKTVKQFKTERVNPADFGKWLENSRKLICEEVPDAKEAVLFYGKNAPIKSEPLPVAPEGYVFKMIDGKLRLLKLSSPADVAEEAMKNVLDSRVEK